MSAKDLFEKQKLKAVSFNNFEKSTIDQFSDTVESSDYLTQKQIYFQTLIPDLDYSTASNFVRFGSAEKYYENSINRVLNEYPYDGSKSEQLEFYNSLNPLEKYIFDNEYPKSTGYVNFSPNGWGTIVGAQAQNYGLSNSPEYIYFYNQAANNIYDPDNGRRENTRFIFSSGSTIEFWMKKDNRPNRTTQTAKEAIFYTATTGSANKDKRVVLYVSGGVGKTGSIFTEYYTDAATKFSFEFSTGISNIADSNWHHYALCYYRGTGGYNVDFYFDGVYKQTQTSATSNEDITGSAFSTIGSLGGKVNGSTDLLGYGKLSGSIDEFRFWNVKRNAKQIGVNYFTQVGGGTNTDLANVDLGVYFKFNEGITQTSSYDSIILDYAGRVSNGVFSGYTSNSRSTGSAIDQATDSVEPQDPIIYSFNPLVSAYYAEKQLSGSLYDSTNTGNLVNSMPSWILEEDANNGNNLTNFLQVLGSYLDTLYLQIFNVNKLKNLGYEQNGGKQNPFNNKLLTSLGFDTPDLFINSDVLKSIFDQDDKRLYEEKIDDIKNQIYKNIYNNLIFINKSKGTEKGFRNLIRCFGADDNLFKLTIYADNADYNFKDKYTNLGIKKAYLDMTEVVDSQNSQAVVYQYPEAGNSNSLGFIKASTNYNIGATLEAELVFPKIAPTYNKPLLYTPTTYVSQSLFGMHQADSADGTNTTFQSPDKADIEIYSVYRDDVTYFVITSSLWLYAETDVFKNVYTDTRWNISFRIKPTEYPFASGAFATSSYIAEFHGYHYDSGELINSFTSSFTLTTGSAKGFYDAAKRIYVGAHRTNITGALLTSTNIKPLAVRYWSDYLDTEEIKIHSRDVRNYGRNSPYKNAFLYEGIGVYVPKIESLSLSWDFETVSSSNGSGIITGIQDIKSASIGTVEYPTAFNNLVGYQFTGQGSYFSNNFQVKKVEYYNSSRNQIPENIDSSDLVQILEADDDKITSSTIPEKLYFSVEASMYDTISRKALEFFSTVVDFNNLVGEPANRYKTEYKDLSKLRSLFFNSVENSPDLDKYVGLYKWVDDALEGVLANLIPASANANDKVRTIVESHVLERNKVPHAFIVSNALPSVNSNNGKINNKNITIISTQGIDGGSLPTASNAPNTLPKTWSSPYSTISDPKLDFAPPVIGTSIPSNGGTKIYSTPASRNYIEQVYVLKPYILPPLSTRNTAGYDPAARYRFDRTDTNLISGVTDITSSEAVRVSNKNVPRLDIGRVVKFSNNSVNMSLDAGTNSSLSYNNPLLAVAFLNLNMINTNAQIVLTPDTKQVFLQDTNIKQQVNFFEEKRT